MTQDITTDDKYDIRYTEPSDLTELAYMMRQEGNQMWFPVSDEKELELLCRNWMSYTRYKCSLTALYEGKVVGIGTLFLSPYKKVAYLAQMYVLVDKEYQKRGIGSSLVKNLKHLGKNYFKLETLHFELYGNCPMTNILKEHGFHQVVFQDKYFQKEGEYYPRTLYEVALA
ncbi:MAG: hypothetical protein S4CHLAM102_04140 [Chlamydiia bacterium]|nr:hypothetical protein [Chlamydiia bacterium]